MMFLEEEGGEEERRASLQKVTDEVVRTNELAFIDMLRCGMLALQMLPENSSSCKCTFMHTHTSSCCQICHCEMCVLCV